MRKPEVQIGRSYVVKVSGHEQTVRLDSESPYGGWIGTNVETKRRVRIKSAQRLRRVADVPEQMPRQSQTGRLRNLGWANAWTETPALVKQCQRLAHGVCVHDREIENVVTCAWCGYVYRFYS